MDWKYLDHTADAKFTAYGLSLEEAFRNCLRASVNILTDVTKIESKLEFPVEKKAKRLEALLYDFLEEMLFLIDTEGIIVCDVLDLKISGSVEEGFSLWGVLVGDKYSNYEVHGDIKAITYNDMEIKKTDKGFEITVVLDI